jgi:tetratricopeptide (TPR) repeat protein
MKTAAGKVLEIFCDGGFGNRYNSLVSGLALAEQCGLQVKVYWPKNESCGAGYYDIFETNLRISELMLSELAGTLGDAYCLLHDTKGSDALRVPFNSAYAFATSEEFEKEVLGQYQRVFYYPAIIPDWIDSTGIRQKVSELKVRSELIRQAALFIREYFGKPFHGIHLRRTDLNVGLSDCEVQSLVTKFPGELFFVCSDDPKAEAMATIHPNVRSRQKTSHVSRKNLDAGWQSPTEYDAGRVYFSNIQRGKEATLEGVIDLLVLSQSQIVSFTGSTFQSVARLIGEVSLFAELIKPAPISYAAVGDIKGMLQAGRLSLGQLLGVCEELVANDRTIDALSLLLEALEKEVGMSRFVILFNLGAYSIRLKRFQSAMVYFRAALEISPESAEAKDAYFKVAQQAFGR